MTTGRFLRIYFGRGTGLFHAEDSHHEWRVGFFPEGVQLAVSTDGGFPIWPVERWFESEDEALGWLAENKASLDKEALG